MRKTSIIAFKLFLAICCVVSFLSLNKIAGIQAVVDDEEYEIIDDTDSRFVYSGNNDANNGGWGSWSDGSGKPEVTEHWSNSAGATLEINFSGTKLELYGKAAANHAMFSVSIDDGEAIECDAYSAQTITEKKLYESDVLPAGDHKALITVLEKRNASSTGSGSVYGVQFVYAKAFGSQGIVEEFPGYSIVEDMQITETDELFKVKYNGVWSGGSTYYPQFHDGYEHYAHNGDSYEIRFIGTKAEIWASVDPGHGVYNVTIDGEDAGQANATATSRVNQQLIYTSPELENGEHVMKVELKDQQEMAIQLDYLKIYHEEIAATSISLDRNEVTLIPGGSAEFTASVEPWVANNKEITWESSNVDVVTVEDGVVTAASIDTKQTAIITARSVENKDVYAQATVTVDPAIAFMNAYVGNEKILDTEDEYEDLVTETRSSFERTAWKGDVVNSKVVVATLGKDVKNVEISASDLVSENGSKLSKENIDIKWLKEVAANIGRGNSSAPIKNFPDVIHQGGTKDISANDVQFAWVQITVPEDIAAGTYTGMINVSADGLKQPFELKYTVEVLNLVQPKPEATEIQIWQHPFSVANYYLGLGQNPSGGISNELAEDFYFTERHFNLMRASMKEYAAMGGHDVVANIVEEAWNHQSYYNDPSMVKWTKKTDGTFEFDYTWYDAWINFQIECGVIDPDNGVGQIKCYSIVPWNNQIAYYDEATGKTVKKSYTPGATDWTEVWESFLTDFMNHSKEKGWFGITYISMDERGLSQLEPAVEMIESVTDENGKHFKVSSALNYSAPEYYDFTDRIDDISINLGNTNVSQMNALSKHRNELGLTTTYYTCTGDYPSNFILSDPGDNYWNMWYTMTLGTDGYMRWAWDNYVYDMHGNISYRYWEPGDGWFIYPMERDEIDEDYNASFYSTPRYEMFKQGIRDVAKAKYLQEQSEELNVEIDELMKSMKRPTSGGNGYGSAVAANQAQRMLAHSETERVYKTISDLAREYTSTIDPVVVNKIALQIAVEMASAVTAEDLDKVVPAVVTEFNAALEEARVILANDNATQEEVDASFARLATAMHMLEFLKGDKAELQDLVDSTAELVEGNYTEESWSALQEALTNANTVLNNENAMQEEVDEAYDNLQAAINGLEEAEVVDKSLLEAMVNKVLGLEEDKYIESTWNAMLPDLEAAQEVLGNEKATQAEVDEACDALTRGYLNLRLKPNKDLLADLINKANGLNAASYTANTWAVVENEVIKAKEVLEDPEASEAEVKAAEKALTKALEGLVAKPGNTVDTSTPVKPGDTTSVKTGDTTNMIGALGLLASLTAIACLKKKKYN